MAGSDNLDNHPYHPKFWLCLHLRGKVQRGWKTMKTPKAEGQRIQYNFVKPHMALEGQTPAQMAGVGVKGNKWMELLAKAVTRNDTAGEIT